MKRTAASIERTAFRLQGLCERRDERFGAQMLRLLGLRATAVQGAANSLEFARNTRVREAELSVLNIRKIALVTQYQAATGGYSALRCEPMQCSGASSNIEQDF